MKCLHTDLKEKKKDRFIINLVITIQYLSLNILPIITYIIYNWIHYLSVCVLFIIT